MSSCLSSSLPVIALLGPTASGKTQAALALARRLPIEIVSVDSALVYRDMDIGTAKPTAAEQQSCPHHLLDIISPEECYSAARFLTEARAAIAAIQQRGRIPLLTGGTMLYFKALHDGLDDFPSANPDIRRDIDAQAAQHGWPAQHARLAALDPATAARLNPNDAQRIQRALEIVLLTQQPLDTQLTAAAHDKNTQHNTFYLGLQPAERHTLHQRIEQRFDAMLQQGFVAEVDNLRRCYTLNATMPSMRCVGYRQVWDYLEQGGPKEQMRFKGIVATRQLAKRQLTWMRQFSERWQNYRCFDCLDPVTETRLYDTVADFVAPYL